MLQKHVRHTALEGFTLIELSIVLVVIGLIIGGILVGKDLIRAAQLRATISQVEKLRSAVNTFKTKYNALPGDIQASQAAAYGFAARTGGAGDGDGDGYIEFCGEKPQNSGNDGLGCETVFFWTDLSAANLFAGSFTTAADVPIINLASSEQFAPYLPKTPIDRSYLFVYDNMNVSGPGPKNYIELLAVDLTTAVGLLQHNAAPNTFPLDPIDAYNIDTKLDDGLPCTGQIIGTWFSVIATICVQGAINPLFIPGGNDCWTQATNPWTYALTSTNPSSNYPSKTCGLQFDAQF